MRRAWARPYNVRAGAGPNWANGVQYKKETSLDVVEEKIDVYEKSTRRQPIPDISEVRQAIPDPFFITLVDTPVHRCRCYFDSRRSVFILQWVEWKDHEYRLSFTYPSFTSATQKWYAGAVKWKTSGTFE